MILTSGIKAMEEHFGGMFKLYRLQLFSMEVEDAGYARLQRLVIVNAIRQDEAIQDR